MKIPITPELTDVSPCPVPGRYEGIPLLEVPSSYFDWLEGQPWLAIKYPALKRYITKNWKAISQDVERNSDD